MAKNKKILKRDLYTIDENGNQTDKGLHDIDGKDDKEWRDLINQMYRKVERVESE